ncbi:hypothetical protein [Burkholderia cenocepacia]|uniref:hypothetical protein n=1 Tax=Burkholderia cenocepacia TaxID=95486 RepID=UPI0026551CF5|nr:hypothetical protein [Burkholderia cenocepacia]MDN7624998.1 hypothetical protein [Burkholderia cenocepacia]
MAELQKANLGAPPGGDGGDNQRVANTKFNSNVDILKTQAALASAGPSITVPRTLTVDEHVGRRVGINLANAGTVKLPSAKKCAADQVILLRNFGTTLVTLAVEDGSGDYIGLDRLQPFETVVMDTNGSTGWWVLYRGRASSGNESVVGNLAAGGKLVGVNSPNLLFNGSGELGVAGGWGPNGFVDAYTGGTGEGTYFSSKAAINSNSYVGSNQIAIGPGTQLTLSGEIHAGGVTAGTVWFRMVYLTASGSVIGTSPNITTTNGYGWVFKSDTRPTPASTAYVYVQLGVEGSPPSVVAGGVSWRRLKLEYGSVPSLYSQEATIAYLGGQPALAGRPTFAGKVPWDSGNLPDPLAASAVQAINATGGDEGDLSNAFQVRLTSAFWAGAKSITACASLYIRIGGASASANDFLCYLDVFDVAAGTVVASGAVNMFSVPNGQSYAGLASAGSLSCNVSFNNLTVGKQYQVRLAVRKNVLYGPIYPVGMSISGMVA